MSENFVSWEVRAVDEAIAEETPRRFRGLNARERYAKEYRENRVFNSYTDSTYGFLSDNARTNAYRSYCDRKLVLRGWLNIERFIHWYARRADRYGKYSEHSPIRYNRT